MTDEHFNDLALRELAWLQRRIAKIARLANLALNDLIAGGHTSAASSLSLMDSECRLLCEEVRSLLLKVAQRPADEGGNHG